MPANVELRPASQMLQVFLPQSHTRIAAGREADVQHALDVARMLMRGFAASGGLQTPQALAYAPSGNVTSRASAVDRSQVPSSLPSPDAWRAARGLPPMKPLPTRTSPGGPSLR